MTASQLAAKSFRQTRAAKFLECTIEDNNGCLLWLGAVSSGYAQATIGNKRWIVHRYIAFSQLDDVEFEAVAFDKNVIAMHSCDNTLCINPAHLSIGTRTQNQLDMYARQRHSRHSKLTEDEVITIRKLAREDNISQRALAEVFGVHNSTINRILLRSIW